MKIAFLSNFYNHHQSNLSKKLYDLTNNQYRFIATMQLPKEQKNLGYNNLNDEFVLFYNENNEEAQEWIDNADVLIVGSADEKILAKRKKSNKIILRYAERPLKNGIEIWKYPVRWIRWHISNPSKKKIYMLCASGYTASDYAKFGMFRNKTFKWGYFPELKKYNDFNSFMMNKDPKEILWCGRLLDWKHPEKVLKIAKWLRRDGYNFHISIIGNGEMEDYLKKYIIDNNLEQYVTMLGGMSPEKVRQFMERAGIYLFTSNRKEGWGAVLNEAMNSGCAVVASNEIGAVPYLVEDNRNGLIYDCGNLNDLYTKVQTLLTSPEEQKRLGERAYYTISSEWNHDVAAERILRLIKYQLLESSEDNIYLTGPCSRT